jgi:hypothetical protein
MAQEKTTVETAHGVLMKRDNNFLREISREVVKPNHLFNTPHQQRTHFFLL